MTLAGMTLAIGPMIDSAIICLENTHRHLGLGATPHEAAFLGASEVAMPELVSTLCTFLVLSPLVFTPGLGQFLFKPMAMAVAFSMIAAYILSRTLVPACSAFWLKPHGGHARSRAAARRARQAATGRVAGQPTEHAGARDVSDQRQWPRTSRHAGPGVISRAFARWERMIETASSTTSRASTSCCGTASLTIVRRHTASWLVTHRRSLADHAPRVLPRGRRRRVRDVRPGPERPAHRGDREADQGGRGFRPQDDRPGRPAARPLRDRRDLRLVGRLHARTPARWTPWSRSSLSDERTKSAQEYVHILRTAFSNETGFGDLEFAFDAGGMVRSAMNEGRSTPISIRVTGKDAGDRPQDRHRDQGRGQEDRRRRRRAGHSAARIIPQYVIKVDRAKAAELGLTQDDVMQNVVAAFNSSIQFNKHNFWIDPKSKNQYFVGVQYYEKDIKSIETLLDIPITTNRPDMPKTDDSAAQRGLDREEQRADRSDPLQHPAHDRADDGRLRARPGARLRRRHRGPEQVRRAGLSPATWSPYDPDSKEKQRLPGSKIVLSGEYLRMKETFSSLAVGLTLASLLIYFLMVGLDKSFVVPLSVMSIVPLCLIGILPMLYVTGSAVNVQSLLGFIFIVGIKVANSVLMTDYAQELRRHEGLTPFEAIRKAASVRVRPITMTALAAFFALVPGALALERGSEANAPLARAILGGLLAGEPATLFVLPVIYTLLVRESAREKAERAAARQVSPPAHV